MLNLRHLALLDISTTQKIDKKQIEVIKNLRFEVSEILKKQSSELKNAMTEYDTLKREYYRRLMKKDQEGLVSTACSRLIINYNRMVDARNICASTKAWRKNFIVLDTYIFRNLACPSLTSQYEELDKLLFGILQSRSDIELPGEVLPIDAELKTIIQDYEELCKTIHDSIHSNDEKCDLEGFSEKLQKAVKEEDDARSEYLKISKILDHAEHLLYIHGESDPNEELLELFTLLENLQL